MGDFVISQFIPGLLKKLSRESYQYLRGRFNDQNITELTLEWVREMSVTVGHLRTALSEVLTREDFLRKNKEEAETKDPTGGLAILILGIDCPDATRRWH
ncbi:hypothetical protein JCGZ_16228 [Jatropha curcas]|uniref:Uncharacterized protein n=1 Tax=Jatropha curcas TaxID=180498 RepID=A0A067K3G9_JATCU|nr:hypothetical protein JCGZ_16228 [Jatropha curcas]